MKSIDELAKEGREAREQKKLARLEAASAQSGKALSTAQQSSSKLGFLANGIIFGQLALMAAIGVGLRLSVVHDDWDVLILFGAGLGTALITALFFFAVGTIAGRRAFSQSVERLLTLPFPVTGYADALASNEGCGFEVTFVAEPAPLALISEAADGLNLPSARVEAEKGVFRISIQVARNRIDEDNHRLYRAIHRVIDDLLVPIHQRFPIRQLVLLPRR